MKRYETPPRRGFYFDLYHCGAVSLIDNDIGLDANIGCMVNILPCSFSCAE